MNILALEQLARTDPDLALRLEKKAAAVKKDRGNLVSAAVEYNKKFDREIEEGTKKRQLLLAEGKSAGLTEEEIFKNNTKFLPTRQTPILNYLYFIMRETEDVDKQLNELREKYNREFGHLNHDEVQTELVQDPPEMFTFIYENMTVETFNKIKKLKALSHSPNEAEALLAYKKCRELCDKYNLEYEKIPCNIED